MPTVHYISRASLRRLGVECPPRTPRRVRRSKLRRHDRRSGTSGDDSSKSGSNDSASPTSIQFALALGSHRPTNKRKGSDAEMPKHDAARGCDVDMMRQRENKKPRRELFAATNAPRTDTDDTNASLTKNSVDYVKMRTSCGSVEEPDHKNVKADEANEQSRDNVPSVSNDTANRCKDTSDQCSAMGTASSAQPFAGIQHRLFLQELNHLAKVGMGSTGVRTSTSEMSPQDALPIHEPAADQWTPEDKHRTIHGLKYAEVTAKLCEMETKGASQNGNKEASTPSDMNITKTTTNPGVNDVLCGRGGAINHHPGNIKFRKLVAAYKLCYIAAPRRNDKPKVANDVVQIWRSMEPPGRFLAQSSGPDDDADSAVWYDIGDKRAMEKVAQCLREKKGPANESVAALAKTVSSSGAACRADYATLQLVNQALAAKMRSNMKDGSGTSPMLQQSVDQGNITGLAFHHRTTATLNERRSIEGSSDGIDASRMVSPELKIVLTRAGSHIVGAQANRLVVMKRADLVHDIVSRVKRTFADRPGVYCEFLLTAKMSKLTEVKSHELVCRILTLLSGHHGLILGFLSLLEIDSKPEVQLTQYAVNVLLAQSTEMFQMVEDISKTLAARMLVIVQNAGGNIDLELILQALHADIPGASVSLPTSDALRSLMSACYWATGKNPVARQAA